MRERAINLRDWEVRAILSGAKTQTRRPVRSPAKNMQREGMEVIKRRAPGDRWYGDHVWSMRGPTGVWGDYTDDRFRSLCPFGAPGDLLWVITIKPIAFGNGRFGVGDDGHVYRVDYAEPRRMRPRISHNGYEEIGLRCNGESQPFRVNRLVAEAFYGPAPTTESQCRHLDGDRRNNRPENLDWGTPAQNSRDAAAAGSFSGERGSSSKLSRVDVDAIRASSDPQAELAARYGVTQPTISKIRNGKRWSAPHAADPPNLPRWASRLTLRVKDVRVERLQDISEDDARAEGVYSLCGGYCAGGADAEWNATARAAFEGLWIDTYGAESWTANPWVWCVSFERVEVPR